MKNTIQDLVAGANNALALITKNVTKFSSKTKHGFLKAISTARKTTSTVASAPMALKIAGFVWALTNLAYTNVVAIVGGALQSTVDWLLAGAKAVTKMLITPIGWVYRLVNATQRLVTKKDMPVLAARAKVNTVFAGVNNRTDQAFVFATTVLMHWYVRFILHASTTFALLAALFLGQSLVFSAVYVAVFMALAILLVSLHSETRNTPAPTLADFKEIFVGYRNRITNFFTSRTVRNLRAENEELKTDLALAIQAAEGFKKAFNRSIKPGKKGGAWPARS